MSHPPSMVRIALPHPSAISCNVKLFQVQCSAGLNKNEPAVQLRWLHAADFALQRAASV